MACTVALLQAASSEARPERLVLALQVLGEPSEVFPSDLEHRLRQRIDGFAGVSIDRTSGLNRGLDFSNCGADPSCLTEALAVTGASQALRVIVNIAVEPPMCNVSLIGSDGTELESELFDLPTGDLIETVSQHAMAVLGRRHSVGGMLQVDLPSDARATLTSSTGQSEEFGVPLHPGRYSVSIEREGFDPIRREVEIERARTSTLALGELWTRSAVAGLAFRFSGLAKVRITGVVRDLSPVVHQEVNLRWMLPGEDYLTFGLGLGYLVKKSADPVVHMVAHLSVGYVTTLASAGPLDLRAGVLVGLGYSNPSGDENLNFSLGAGPILGIEYEIFERLGIGAFYGLSAQLFTDPDASRVSISSVGSGSFELCAYF